MTELSRQGETVAHPQLGIQAKSVHRSEATRIWDIEWHFSNSSDAPLWLHSVRIPHDQFHGQDREFAPARELAARSEISVVIPTSCAEPPGSTLTYPFVIVRCSWSDRQWRVFARLRVETDERGAPNPIIEEITAQPSQSES